MLIVRAPVRISFAGGGTDVEAYYRANGGMVISTSINKYFYSIINDSDDGATQIISSDYGTLFSIENADDLIWDGDLALPKAVLHHFGYDTGQNVFIACEVPPGTGLGSSSAATVSLIHAFAQSRGIEMERHEIADLACAIEIEKLRMPIGKQDQYASAFGGLNCITFEADGVEVERLKVAQDVLHAFERRLMLFYTGLSRKSTGILRAQNSAVAQADPAVIASLDAIKATAADMRIALETGDLDSVGALLHEHWERKKRLAANSNSFINDMYDLARREGASGGKLNGAGGGGFMMLFCDEARQPAVTAALQAHGLRRMHFRFDDAGVQTLLNTAEVRDSFRDEPGLIVVGER